MPLSQSNPEVYWTKPSLEAPNSRFPILVYRNVLPTDQGPEAMVKIIESNNWLKRGIWGHIPKPHYHSTVHECYAPISGWTRVLYGVSSKDDPADGVSFEMKAGDVEVHPAGTSHCHLESSADYRYFGLYPKDAARTDSVYHQVTLEVKAEKFQNAQKCPIPDYDPVYGFDGPLPKLWREANRPNL